MAGIACGAGWFGLNWFVVCDIYDERDERTTTIVDLPADDFACTRPFIQCLRVHNFAWHCMSERVSGGAARGTMSMWQNVDEQDWMVEWNENIAMYSSMCSVPICLICVFGLAVG